MSAHFHLAQWCVFEVVRVHVLACVLVWSSSVFHDPVEVVRIKNRICALAGEHTLNSVYCYSFSVEFSNF